MEQRIIKFKAKRLDNGEWVTGDLLQVSENDIQIYNKDCGGYDYPVDPSTVCQFTGLTDKNGTLVYENDIIQDPWIIKATRLVEWNPFICRFCIYGDQMPLGELISQGWTVACNKFDRKEKE